MKDRNKEVFLKVFFDTDSYRHTVAGEGSEVELLYCLSVLVSTLHYDAKIDKSKIEKAFMYGIDNPVIDG